MSGGRRREGEGARPKAELGPGCLTKLAGVSPCISHTHLT